MTDTKGCWLLTSDRWGMIEEVQGKISGMEVSRTELVESRLAVGGAGRDG